MAGTAPAMTPEDWFKHDRNAVSRLAIVRIPILFEIADQCRTEMAIGLLAGIHGHVAAKPVQRLLRDAQRAPVAHCTHGAGTAPRGNHTLDRIVHRTGGDGFVTDEPIERMVSAWSRDWKSTRLNSSHQIISYAVFCLKKKTAQRST